MPLQSFITAALALLAPAAAHAAALAMNDNPVTAGLTHSGVGYASLLFFVIAYLVVMAEEFIHLRKSKPVILAAGIIWGMIASVYAGRGDSHTVESALGHNLLEFSELFLFLLSAMTYVNALDERLVFEALRSWLVRKGFGYRSLFWLTGGLAFCLSPVLDNLTTGLIMCAVLLAVGRDNIRFITPGCVNIVVAANASGAFSPFGDITTLMVWQHGAVGFGGFLLLFIPSLVNFLVPAAFMHFAIPAGKPQGDEQQVRMRRGGRRIMILFAATIVTTVCFHQFLYLPPFLGMMTGLAYLQFFGYYLRKSHRPDESDTETIGDISTVSMQGKPFDIFRRMARAEWDTLLFFYGVVLCVGGLGFIGYLALLSQIIYIDIGPTFANVAVGIVSAVVDNIPVMFAVLSMNPDMSLGHWLLVTLTAGVGGSLLSIGSAAGVALMGQARGRYTFFGHLKWTPVILLGYAACILAHLWLNSAAFQIPARG
jgi:NhaD family Na+/H+ antiporter